MKHIILFDLDGTLTDPMVGITKSVQYALRAYGIDEPDLKRLCPFIGPPLTDSFQEFYGFSREQAREAIEKYREYFAVTGIFENKVYPGIPELLAKLKADGHILAVATSKPEEFAVRILKHFQLLSYFAVVGGADMEEKRVKKGEVIAYTLKRLLDELRVSGTEEIAELSGALPVVMVGDRLHDVKGAAENAIPCIGVLFGYGSRGELEEAGAFRMAESVEKLGELLTGLE